MTKVNNIHQGFSLHEKAQEILSDLPEISENELNYEVFDNTIKIKFDHPDADFKLSVVVTLADTVETVEQKFRTLYDEHMEYLADQNASWEHPSVTQGYAFDLLTL